MAFEGPNRWSVVTRVPVYLQVMRTSPYGVHADYIFGGLIAKRNRLREAQIWLDEPSYYSSPRLLQVVNPTRQAHQYHYLAFMCAPHCTAWQSLAWG